MSFFERNFCSRFKYESAFVDIKKVSFAKKDKIKLRTLVRGLPASKKFFLKLSIN